MFFQPLRVSSKICIFLTRALATTARVMKQMAMSRHLGVNELLIISIPMTETIPIAATIHSSTLNCSSGANHLFWRGLLSGS